MYPVLAGETIAVDLDLFPTCKPAAHALTRFENKRLQSPLGQVQGGGQPGDAPAYNDGFMVFLHRKDYIRPS